MNLPSPRTSISSRTTGSSSSRTIPSGSPRHGSSGTVPLSIHDLEQTAETIQPNGGRYKPTSDDDACFKLWNMYISQAQEYDKSLIEGWKSDMDGMILFSALYSASLTAFLIESYKRLQADPGDTTVTILTQISQQLASIPNGTSLPFQEPPLFQPSTSSLVCNILWFLSLALALTCSLLATFVQQWTRDFMHKTTMRPSPVVQARVLAFSYFGLRRFGMHTFVDIIPILLHISLFLFFAGLVGFLLPVNLPLTYLMACVLAVFMMVYFGLSCIPLLFLDAPYRTPFSDFFWRLGNRLHGLVIRRHKLVGELSLTEAIVEKSLQNPEERDRQCMEYTMKSLNHDSELVPMFEAVGEAVLSPRGVRLVNYTLVAPLLRSTNPDHNIISRMASFIWMSGTSADPTRQTYDLTTSLNALWSLAHLVIQYSIQTSADPSATPQVWFHVDLLHALNFSDSAPSSHLISAIALVRTSRMQSLKHCIDVIGRMLYDFTIPAHERLHTADTFFRVMSIDDIDWHSAIFKYRFLALGHTIQEGCAPGITETRAEELVQQAQEIVYDLRDPGRWKAALISILGQFLRMARNAMVLPVEMHMTCTLVCTSLQPHIMLDPIIEVEDDEAEASFLLQGAFYENYIPPVLFFYFVELFFSTRQACSSPSSAECRGYIQNYLHELEETDLVYLLNRDHAGYFEECVLQDLRANDAYRPGWCTSVIDDIYYALGLRTGVSPRLRRFAKQIFDLIPTLSTKFVQTRWWNLANAQTEWVLCKDILVEVVYLSQDPHTNNDDTNNDLPIMDDIRCLGHRLLPDFSVPECPSTRTAEEYQQWIEQLRAYVMSMNLLIIAKFTVMATENTAEDPLLGDWDRMRADPMINYEGHIYEKVQIQFAQNVSKLVSLVPWNQTDKESPAVRLFNLHLWVLSRSWAWISDVECARILVEAIQRHKNDKNFKGMVWYEQACFDRCMQVIQDFEAKTTEERIGMGNDSGQGIQDVTPFSAS